MLVLWSQIVSFRSNAGEGACGAMTLNSLKLRVSFRFFPVGKEIRFLQKIPGLRGQVSNCYVLLWRWRGGNLHVVYSHITSHANTWTFWGSTVFLGSINISKRPSQEWVGSPGDTTGTGCSLPSTATSSQARGHRSSPPDSARCRSLGPRAVWRDASPSRPPWQPDPCTKMGS